MLKAKGSKHFSNSENKRDERRKRQTLLYGISKTKITKSAAQALGIYGFLHPFIEYIYLFGTK